MTERPSPFDLGGSCRSAVRASAEAARVDAVRRAAELLDASDDPGVRAIGAGLRRWLGCGGDLVRELGLRPRPGKPSAARAAALERRDAGLRALAAALPAATATDRARALLAAAREGRPELLALHCDAAPLPSSEQQILRVLREAR